MHFGPQGWEHCQEWYRLSATDGTKLVLAVSPQIAEMVGRLDWPETPIVLQMLKTYPAFNCFDHGKNDRFGFNGACSKAPSSDGWIDFTFDLAPIGARVENDPPSIDWVSGYSISSTLGLLLQYITWIDSDLLPQGDPLQSLIITCFFASQEMSGCPLGAVTSVGTKRWLESKAPLDHWPEVVKVMRQSYDLMTRGFEHGDDLSRHYTRACVREPAQLTLDCPGDSCGLYVDGMFHYEENYGIQLDCHNVDAPHQQLALMMGLARICDIYRQETGQVA